MKLKEFIKALTHLKENGKHLHFALPNGKLIPEYFHITEMGFITKTFIDCGHTLRQNHKVSFQIWFAKDYDHKLSSDKLLKVIEGSESILKDNVGMDNFSNVSGDLDVVFEYQTDLSLSQFSTEFKGGIFHLKPIDTTCLASNHCGISPEQMRTKVSDIKDNANDHLKSNVTNSAETESTKNCCGGGCC